MKILIPGKAVELVADDFVSNSPELVHHFEIQQTRGEKNAHEIDLAEDDITEFKFDDDTVWYASPEDVALLFKDKNRGAGEAIKIPVSLRINTENRGFFPALIKFIRIFKPQIDKVTSNMALSMARRVESKILNPGLHYVDENFDLSPYDKTKSDEKLNVGEPVLLFIHGTGSTTKGSFSALSDSQSWPKMLKKYGNNILAYEHRTWSESPLENVLQLLKALPENIRLHLVTFSRGGLVGDILCRSAAENEGFSADEIASLEKLERVDDVKLLKEINKIRATTPVFVEKYIRVACPAAGTTLLSTRLDTYLNVLLNLVGRIPVAGNNPVFEGMKVVIQSLLKQRATPNVLPGLESMIPDSPLQQLINAPNQSVSNELIVIAGNLATGRVLQTLRFIVARLYFWQDNDLVVDTDSMFLGVVRSTPSYYKFVSDGAIHHCAYFQSKGVQEAILRGLTTSNISHLPDFKMIKKGSANRNVEIIPGGEVMTGEFKKGRETVILIPGILGSNLYASDEVLWLKIWKIFGGVFNRMKINAKDVEAKSAVGSAYKKLCEYLSNDYNVIVYPFDWRKSVTEAAEKLSALINKDLLPDTPSIQIIAHSMGGLVVRELIDANGGETWNKLKEQPNFRAILLGTPWKGSYLISELLTGRGSRLNTISRLALFQSKKDLLKIFTKFKGLYDLLPVEGHDFEDQQLWKALSSTFDSHNWVIPPKDALNYFANYKKRITGAISKGKYNAEPIYYVAGKSDRTVSHFVLRDQFGEEINSYDTSNFTPITKKGNIKRYSLIYQATPDGDGSVTWESGVPEGVKEAGRLYFMPTGHGELANDEAHFPAIKALLVNGDTDLLSKALPISRSDRKLTDLPIKTIVPNDYDSLVKEALGLNNKLFEKQTIKDNRDLPLKVRVKNGDLRYASYPVLIGHFENDGIVSAEKAMDYLLNQELTERRSLNLYPGPIGTHHISVPKNKVCKGVVVVGLGQPEALTPYLLTETIAAGCLEYLYNYTIDPNKEDQHIGISSLLIGSNYGNLNLNSSITAILDGIRSANQKIRELDKEDKDKIYATISTVEFIELYENRSINTFFCLDERRRGGSSLNVNLQSPLRTAAGKRTLVPIDNQREWWKRITTRMMYDHNRKPSLAFSSTSGQAKVDVRDHYTNLTMIDALLERQAEDYQWNDRSMRTIFEMLVPNDFKIAFRDRQNMLLVLDKSTAKYPWELFQYEEQSRLPISVTAGMIRQLQTKYSRSSISNVRINTALVVGDPKLGEQSLFSQLPGAKVEADNVVGLLRKKKYEVTSCVNTSYQDVLLHLFEAYKVIHIASHGVIDHNGDKGNTGILLSDDMVITPREINQMRHVPELVFVNSCYLGKMDVEAEEYTRKKYELAANIGTQFIEKGVKAVVVAGWPVDDNAALLFAQVFYEQMLDGVKFGEAVKATRRKCFETFPGFSTWGAYQCYGDQFYQLTPPNNENDQEDQTYAVEKEALIDLERILNYASTYSGSNIGWIEEALDEVILKIDRSGIRTSRVAEREAMILEELERYDEALEKYRSVFKEKGQNHSFRALEKLCNLEVRVIANKALEDSELDYKTVFDQAISRLEQINEFGKTSERLSLIGSAYKRIALVESNKAKMRAALKTMASYYKEAFELKCDELFKNEVYPLTNWLIAELIMNDKARLEKVKEDIGMKIEELLNEKLEWLKKEDLEQNDFWDLIKGVNIYQTLLLIASTQKVYKKTNAKIQALYDKAWKKAGTKRQRASEKEHIKFVIDGLKKFRPKEKGLILEFEDLANYFDEM